MDIGFDEILHTPRVSTDNIGVSPSGHHVVSSSPYSNTFSEHPMKNQERPVEIMNGSADRIGFFGRDLYLIAIASGNILRILDYYHLTNILTTTIRPGSLFVPDSASSRYIGVVSPQGQAIIIDDEGKILKTPLKVDPEYTILWSSSVRPVGYLWSEGGSVNLYIRSTEFDKGSILSSSHGINVYGVWSNPHLKRHEVFITTYDKPHILKRVSSSKEGAVVDDVVIMEEGTFINQVIKLSNGKPAVVTGLRESTIVSEAIPPETNVGKLMQEVMDNQERMTYAKLVGDSSFASWTQTPVTVPVGAVTLYGNEGRPRYEIKGNIIDSNNITPVTNEVRLAEIAGKDYFNYRIVSPFTLDKHMAKEIIMIADDEGMVSSGKFSPTVRKLYELGVPVALVPLFHDEPRKQAISRMALDMVDVSNDILKNKFSSDVVVMANDDLCSAALEAMKHKKSRIAKGIFINPQNSVISHKNVRKKNIVSTYFDVNPGDIKNDGMYKVIEYDTTEQAEREVDAFFREFAV